MKTLGVIAAMFVVLAVASSAPGGGIADEPCPNARSENTNTCPSGTVDVPYSIRFVETVGSGCGPGRQTFHLDSGLLPPGFTLSLDGTLSGVSPVAGTYRFYVEMREPDDDPANCAGKRTQKEFTLAIRRQPWVVAPAVPESEVGLPFQMRLRARGGSGTFAWRLAGGRLPPGVKLGRDGSLRGTPRASGTYPFDAQATDTESRSVTWSGLIAVATRLRLRITHLPAARVGHPYRADLTTNGGLGSVVWRLERGRLPRGVRFERKAGRLSGTPRTSGRFEVTVAATDELEVTLRRTLTLLVLGDGMRLP